MDSENLGSDITNALREFKNLHSANEERKQSVQELTEAVALLREELKLARDAEQAAELRKSRCLGFVSQQQEAILKLLNVKEENENLKQTIDQLEKTISEIQNNILAERVKKDAEIRGIKQDTLRELIEIQETADQKLIKEKAELASSLEELKTTISKSKEKIDQQTETILSLRAEIKDLKERAEANLEIFQKKLAEQNRKHQAELDTWKLAELNQSMYHEQSTGYGTCIPPPNSHLGQSENLYLHMQDYQRRTSFQNQPLQNREFNSYQNVPNPPQYLNQNRPFVVRSKNNSSKGAPNVVRPLQQHPSKNSYQKSSDFISVSELFMENNSLGKESAAENEQCEEKVQNAKTSSTEVAAPITNKRRKLFNSNENLL